MVLVVKRAPNKPLVVIIENKFDRNPYIATKNERSKQLFNSFKNQNY